MPIGYAMSFKFSNGFDRHKYHKMHNLYSQHWINSSFCDSGSLLVLDELSNIGHADRDSFWQDAIESFHGDPAVNLEFRQSLGNLIQHQCEPQATIQLKEVHYVYGGTDCNSFDYQHPMNLGQWWKAIGDHKYSHQISADDIDVCLKPGSRLDGVNGFIRRSWHKGLMMSGGDSNHRLGNLAYILSTNPDLNPIYTDQLDSYTLNQSVLNEILERYAVYIVIQEDTVELECDLMLELEKAFAGQEAHCMKLSESFTSYSLSKRFFKSKRVRIYFIKKRISNFILRRYLNVHLNNNEIIKKILSDK